MAKEIEMYSPKPWELSQFFLAQWNEQGKLFLPYCGVVVQRAEVCHIAQIAKLIAGNVALVGVGTPEAAEQTVGEFVNDGRGLVGMGGTEVISFQGLGLWEFGVCELRSARTKVEFEGNGINMTMKKLMIHEAYKRYNQPFIGFTEATSGSRGILAKLGFKELSMGEVHKGLAAACPSAEEFTGGQDMCALRCGGECGCKVFLLDVDKFSHGY